MYLTFNTRQKAEMKLECGYSEDIDFNEKNGNVKQFYSSREPIIDVGLLEKPVSEQLFKQLT